MEHLFLAECFEQALGGGDDSLPCDDLTLVSYK